MEIFFFQTALLKILLDNFNRIFYNSFSDSIAIINVSELQTILLLNSLRCFLNDRQPYGLFHRQNRRFSGLSLISVIKESVQS